MMKTTSIGRTLGTPAVAALAVLGTLAASPAGAQERPRAAAELSAGWVGFADDGIVSEGLFGGAARFYVSPRISVGPEIGFIEGRNHSHLVLTGNLTCDLLSPARGPRPVTPFIVAGGGLFQTREQLFSGGYTSSEGAYTVGGGVRARAGTRATIGVEARMGWEAHIRVNALVGIQLWR
jgi:hypothetical protein